MPGPFPVAGDARGWAVNDELLCAASRASRPVFPSFRLTTRPSGRPRACCPRVKIESQHGSPFKTPSQTNRRYAGGSTLASRALPLLAARYRADCWSWILTRGILRSLGRCGWRLSERAAGATDWGRRLSSAAAPAPIRAAMTSWHGHLMSKRRRAEPSPSKRGGKAVMRW